MTEPKWSAVRELAEAGLTASQAQIEAHGTSHEDTEYHRGRIAAFRAVLRLQDPPRPGIGITSPDYG